MPQPLTRWQLVQLTKEYEALEAWTTVKQFCDQVYGKNCVTRVEIETHSEWNDEDGYDYSVESLTAYDKDDNELTYDLTLPFWQQFEDLQKEIQASYSEQSQEHHAQIDRLRTQLNDTRSYTERRPLYEAIAQLEDGTKDDEELQEMAQGELREWATYGEAEKRRKEQGLIAWDELPAFADDDGRYDLTTEPQVSFPVVYTGVLEQ